MLWDGEVRTNIWLAQYNMATDLTHDLPTGFGEGLDSFFAGDIGEACHAR